MAVPAKISITTVRNRSVASCLHRTCVLALLAVGLVAAASLSERAAKSPSAAQGLAADPVPIVRAPRLPDPPFRYELGHDLPAHFREGLAPRFDNTPPDNPVTDAGGQPPVSPAGPLLLG